MSVDISVVARLRGRVRTPGDKSISHRAVMLAALADGRSRIDGCSNGDDVRATIRIVAQLGATVYRDGESFIIVGPPGGLSSSPEPLDCGNSGTTIRLLCGLLASAPGDHLLVGDDSLSRRPMDRVAGPLGLMGLSITGQGERVLPPLRVRSGTHELTALDYQVPVPSAQVKSAILFAALRAESPCHVSELIRTRANTEEMLRQCGVDVVSEDVGEGRRITIAPSRPTAVDWRVPGDPSQSAFFVVLALLHPDAEIDVVGLYGGAERTGYVGVLERMGAQLVVTRHDDGIDVSARSSTLTATTIDSREIPSVDEVPILAVAAAAAQGTTRFVNVAELRLKESDRFAGTIELLARLGVHAYGEGDDLVVDGVGSAGEFETLTYEGALDHRMVMSAAVAAASGQGGFLSGVDTVASSYPRFFDDLASLQ